MDTPTRNPRTVTAALRRAGIPTGYRYTQTGYRDHDNNPVTAPGVMVTRQKRARYGGQEDLGHVAVYPVDPSRGDSTPSADFQAEVLAALTAAGLPATARGSLSIVVADA